MRSVVLGRTKRGVQASARTGDYFTQTLCWQSSHFAITVRSWNCIAPQFWQTIIRTLTGALLEEDLRSHVSI